MDKKDKTMKKENSIELVKTLRKGNQLFKENKYEEALEVFNQSLEMNQEIAAVWAVNGILQLKLNKFSKAEESFQKAIENDARDPYFWAGLGYVLTMKNEYQKAKDAYRNAVEKGIKIEDLLVSHLQFVQNQLKDQNETN